MTFWVLTYQNSSHAEILELTSTAADLFHLITEFENVNNKRNEITLYLVNDQFQESTSDTCGIFQLHFYKNFFDPLHSSKVTNDDKLIMDTVLKLLNELFSSNRQENEARVKWFAAENSIMRKWKILNAVQGLTIFFYPKLLTLDRF